LFQRSAPLQAGVWDKMMRGLSTRNYGAVVKEFTDAYGIEKSARSRSTILNLGRAKAQFRHASRALQAGCIGDLRGGSADKCRTR
jgi:hypothetical protein